MANLEWQDTPKKTAAPQAAAGSNMWFGVSMVLMGLVGGYVIGQSNGGALNLGAGSQQVAQVPTPPPAAPSAPTPPPPSAPVTVKAIDLKRDHIRGNPDATVAIIEYSDFECPFCKRHHPTMKQITDTYGDKVMWVYRHYPLSFHQNAQPAAEATECAYELGGNDAFWKFADKLMGGDNYDYAAMAKEFGLDEAKFKACNDSHKYAQYITDDMTSGSNAGVDGTPGNIVYNVKTQKAEAVSGAQPFDAFKPVIDGMLNG